MIKSAIIWFSNIRYRINPKVLILSFFTIAIWICLKFSQSGNNYWSLLTELLFAIIITFGVNLIAAIFSDFIEDRPPSEEYLKNVKNELKIFGMTLYNIHKDENIIQDLIEKFEGSSKKTLRIGYVRKQFQFLILNPYSKAFEERANYEGKDPNLLRFECAKTVKNLDIIIDRLNEKNLIDKEKNKTFEYRFYDLIPFHSMIITEKCMWVGPYLFKKPGTDTKWFQITNPKAYFQYSEEFDNIWTPEYSFSKESIQNSNYNVKRLFLIAKYIPSEIFDQVILKQKKICDNQYETIFEFASYIEKNKMAAISGTFKIDKSKSDVIKVMFNLKEFSKEVEFFQNIPSGLYTKP